MKPTAPKQYIGDGVYVTGNQRNQLEVTTENGVNVTNVIYFEDEVLEELLKYIDRHDRHLYEKLHGEVIKMEAR